VLVINDQGGFFADNGRAIGERGVDAGSAAQQNDLPGAIDSAEELTVFVGSVSSTLDSQLTGGVGWGAATRSAHRAACSRWSWSGAWESGRTP
jgi:hypothetical protein